MNSNRGGPDVNGTCRLTVGLITLAAAYYGLELRHPGWLGDLREALGQRQAWQSVLDQEEAEKQRLTARYDDIATRLELRGQIAREVARGSLSLDEAALRFRSLAGEVPPRNMVEFRLQNPGLSEDDLFRRQVVLFVEAEARDWPDGPEVVERVRKEMKPRSESRLLP